MANVNIKLKDGSNYLLPQTKTNNIIDLNSSADVKADLLDAQIKYVTEEPTEDCDGIKFALLDSNPSEYKDNWLYLGLPEYLCFTANTAGSTITLDKVGSPSWTGYYTTIQPSNTCSGNWIEYVPGTTGVLTLTNAGDKVYFKGIYTAANSYFNYLQFTMTGSIAASGNIMSFCSGDSFESVTAIPYNYTFNKLFYNCTSLTTAPALPATTLAEYCYTHMFSGCSSLQVYSTSGEGHTHEWRIPTSGTLIRTSSNNTWMMFYNTIGDYASASYPGGASATLLTLYTQNEPI